MKSLVLTVEFPGQSIPHKNGSSFWPLRAAFLASEFEDFGRRKRCCPGCVRSREEVGVASHKPGRTNWPGSKMCIYIYTHKCICLCVLVCVHIQYTCNLAISIFLSIHPSIHPSIDLSFLILSYLILSCLIYFVLSYLSYLSCLSYLTYLILSSLSIYLCMHVGRYVGMQVCRHVGM